MAWTAALPYFTKKELACQHCGELKLGMSFATHFPVLRFLWGSPLTPSSVCRCRKHNTLVGGHPRSLHMTDNPERDTDGCLAADIAWHSWPDERKLDFSRLAWSQGWSIGLSNSFIHVDRRTAVGLPQRVFTYEGWAGGFDALDVTGGPRSG